MLHSHIEARVENLNRRMESRRSDYHYKIEYRNGHVGLDRYIGDVCMSTVTVGTKREVGDFLHAMMVALDDAAYKADDAELTRLNLR